MQNRLAAVTIYHLPDFDYMRLQARSFRRYANTGVFSKIIVFENFDRKFRNRPWHHRLDIDSFRTVLLREYGELADLVCFCSAQDFLDLPRMTGWRSQQLLKILAEGIVDTDKYVVFDAKNHLIGSLRYDHLVSPDGRASMQFQRYAENHPLWMFFESSLRYFNIDVRDCMASFPQTMTPFIFYRDYARNLIQYIEKREGASLPSIFVAKNFSEFFLYAAYLVSVRGSFNDLYCKKTAGEMGRIIWPHMNDAGKLTSVLQAVEGERGPFFAVHRHALRGMSGEAQRLIARFWVDRKLFQDEGEARAFLRTQARRQRLDSLATHLRRQVKKARWTSRGGNRHAQAEV